MKSWFSLLMAMATIVFLTGCGGGGGGSVPTPTRNGQLLVVGVKAANLRTGINLFPKGPQGKAVGGISYLAHLRNHTLHQTRNATIQLDADFPPLYSTCVFNDDGSFAFHYFTDPNGRNSAGNLIADPLQSTSTGARVHFTLGLTAGPPPAAQYPLSVNGDYNFFNDNTSEITGTLTDPQDGTINFDCTFDANGNQTACTQTAPPTTGSNGSGSIAVTFVSTNPNTGISTYNVSDTTDGITGQLFVSLDNSGSGLLRDSQGQSAKLQWGTNLIGTITYLDSNGNVIGTDTLNLNAP